MQNLNFYIIPFGTTTQTLIPPPDNWQDLQLELSYEETAPETVLNATKLIFKGSNAAIMDNWLTSGTTGGPSIFVGIPLIITACDSNDVVFNGIIDLTDPDTKFTCDIVTVKIRDWRVDMVTEEMSAVSYAYLAAPVSLGGAGIIDPNTDYVTIPYQRNDIPDGVEFVTTGMAIYQIFTLLENAIDTLGEDIAGLSDILSDVWGILAVIAEIVWIIFLMIAIVDMLKIMFSYLISPVLTKFGMYARVLLQKACDYFQIQFSSTILNDPSSPYYQTVCMPQKQAWVTNQTFARNIMTATTGGSTVQNRMEYDDLYNFNHASASSLGEQSISAYGYYDGTPSDLIASLEKVFCAKAKIIANTSGVPVLHFERWDYQYNTPLFTLPNISDQAPFNSHGPFNTSGQSRSAFSTNAASLPANYFIKYAMDDSDLNTYNYYEGTSCMATTQLQPISTYYVPASSTLLPDANYAILLKGLTDIEFEFAQAFRKDKLSAVEEAFQPIYSECSFIMSALIAIPNGAISIINHLLSKKKKIKPVTNPLPPDPGFFNTGAMLLSQNVTGQPKILIVESNQTNYSFPGISDWSSRNFNANNISEFSKGLLGARYLMRNFHWSILPVSTVPTQSYTISVPSSTGTPTSGINLPAIWTSNLTNSLGSANQYPAPGSSYYNQWITMQDQVVPVCCADFQLIQNNNCMLTVDGKTAKVDSIKWNVFKGLANMDYRIQQIYASNMSTLYIVDGQTFVQNGFL